MERRFHSPYRHWFSGLLTEIGVFIAVMLVLSAVGIISAWIFG